MSSRPVALLGSTHPGPSLAVTLVAVVLALGLGLEPWRVLLLGLAVAANQASVGWSNDWIDAGRDRAVGRTDKPVARGDISEATVRTAAFVAAGSALALTIPLGLAATAVHATFIASAWSYNFGLKSTVFSVVPYVVSFGLLPSLVTLSSSNPTWPAWWAFALGGLLGVAAHFANVLPDLDDDRATGVRGLPHRIGRRAAGLVTFVSLGAAASVALIAPGGAPSPLQYVGAAVTGMIAIGGTVLVLSRPPTRLLFQLIIVAAIITVVMIQSTAGRMLA